MGSEGGVILNLCCLYMELNVFDGYGMEYVGFLEGLWGEEIRREGKKINLRWMVFERGWIVWGLWIFLLYEVR